MNLDSPRTRAFWPMMYCMLCCMAAPASGAGLNLAWDHCLGQGTGVQNANFACDSNAGSRILVASFVLPADMSIVIGTENVIDLASASATLPAWWQLFSAGSCRPSSLIASLVPDPIDVNCPDWSQGFALGGLGGYCTLANAAPGGCGVPGQSANTARIKSFYAVAPDAAQSLTAGQEYLSLRLRIDNAKTVGAGACGGCLTPVCIVLNSIDVVERNNVSHRFLSTPTGPGTNFATWQGGGVPSNGVATGCPAATPARRSAWSEVKALYR